MRWYKPDYMQLAFHWMPLRTNRAFRASLVAISVHLALVASAKVSRTAEPANKLPPAAQREIEFARDVEPLLSRRCFKCHGPEKQESNFRLDDRAAALRGGDLGEPAIVPGKSEESFLLKAVAGLAPDTKMPPEGERLTAAEIGVLRAWIEQGAKWSAKDGEVDSKPVSTHWSFQPLTKDQPPITTDQWVASHIDAFILAKLKEKGLTPSPPAHRVQLVRRLYLDALGLPPTPEEIESFVSDERINAYERLVDRVLASPRYGERWARHWLDVVRFAETDGFEMNQERPNAYHYRDYVVRAFNTDKPYDRFAFEQLAGDAVGADAATGFLVGGAFDKVKSPDVNLTQMQRQDELADMVNTTSAVFLGLTVGCARCHNHKFDPILQKDFYALQAVFAGVNHGERRLPAAEMVTASRLREAVNVRENSERFPATRAKFVRMTISATNGAEPCIDELEVYTSDRNVALASAGAKATSSSNLPGYEIHKLEHLNDGRYGNGRSWISNEPGRGWVQIELAEPVSIDRIVWGRDREGKFQDRLATQYVLEVADKPGEWRAVASSADRRPFAAGGDGQLAYAGNFSQPATTHRLYRGDPSQKREPVVPDALAVLDSLSLTVDAPESSRRKALATWLGKPTNPLPARVIVNRLWQYHFGTGLVATPSDFGKNGALPSHPELLDWLAGELQQSGWSLKHIQRLILTSSTYRQASATRADGLAIDAESRLLWRFPPRRLEAEAIRDQVLAVAGSLDLSMYGPGFSGFLPNSNYVRVYTPREEWKPAEWRRMIYMHKVRMEYDPVFGAFDCPDAGLPTPKRSASTTAVQALNLLNSNFMLQQADLFATRIRRDSSDSLERQVREAFRLAFGRPPEPGEQSAAAELVSQHGLPALCRALLNANEFLFVP